jgi:glycosyltransferase involved in cell wall biosynthesis
MNVLVISSNPRGGPSTTTKKLVEGLTREGINAHSLTLSPRLPSTERSSILRYMPPLLRLIYNEFEFLREDLDLYQHIILMDLYPFLIPLLRLKSSGSIILYVQGYLYHQFINFLKYSSVNTKIGSLLSMNTFDVSKRLGYIDHYLCTCASTCRSSSVPVEKSTLLPLWLSEGELAELKKYEEESLERSPLSNRLLVLAYTSNVFSPKLLSGRDILYILLLVSKRVKRDFKAILIDPFSTLTTTKNIQVVNFLAREKFLRLLSHSSLLIDPLIDEELRNTTLEAMALGVPVVKLLSPYYINYADYNDKDLLLAHTIKELEDLITEYLNNIESYYNYYRRAGKKFVMEKRVWDSVKEPLLKYLYSSNKNRL